MNLHGKLREICSKTRKGGVIATFWKQRREVPRGLREVLASVREARVSWEKA
jgi:hypothetical protein